MMVDVTHNTYIHKYIYMIKSMESRRVRLMRLDHHHYQQYHVVRERSIREVNTRKIVQKIDVN